MTRTRLRARRAYWGRKLAFRRRRLAHAKRVHNMAAFVKWNRRVREARREIHVIDRKLNPMRMRAYRFAVHEVGVMEKGGNNRGVPFERYQRANGAVGPEPWCGDFMAWCYRKAGSKSVTRSWAAVRLLPFVSGVHRRHGRPRKGDLVRFTFDHVGMYVRDMGDGTILTIEGNTGAVGAVSDSVAGGDGVYMKHRAKYLVRDYLAVWR